jgi:enediyne biosynthesis protein E4
MTRWMSLAVAVLAMAHVTGAAQRPGGSAPSEAPLIRFEHVSKRAGLTTRLTAGSPAKLLLPESTGGGVALFDFDNDGWLDVFLVNGSTLNEARRGTRGAPNSLYRNNGDGTFTDVSARAGVTGRHWGMGACVGDINADGFDDVYVTNLGPDELYVNNGDGTFRDASAQAGTADAAYSSSCAFADADADGDLDVYVTNYFEFDLAKPPTRANDGSRCGYRGLDVACGPRGLTPTADRYYENLGDGRFRDATARAGFGSVNPSFGMGVVWGDYDGDDDQDLFVANDEMPNFLFRNNGNGTFTEVGVPAGVALSPDGRAQGSMGADFGDYDNDGDLDLVVTNYADDYDTLYVNQGNGAFADGTREGNIAALSTPPVGWGVLFADLDLDGWVDLSVANGHLYPQLDTLEGLPVIQNSGYRQRSLFFRNVGNRRFMEIGERVGAGFRSRDRASSRGLAAGDLDNDGRIDLVMTSLDEPPSVLMNRTTPGNWLLVKLKGTRTNRSAIGARVVARVGSRSLRRDVKGGHSYQSQSDLRLHFGLGTSNRIDELSVHWPGGRVETRRNVAANTILVVEEAAVR